MNITQGKRGVVGEDGRTYDTARRLYDRLRKRSYRRMFTVDGYLAGWGGEVHEAYVAGVRDTLNEILALDEEYEDEEEEYFG